MRAAATSSAAAAAAAARRRRAAPATSAATPRLRGCDGFFLWWSGAPNMSQAQQATAAQPKEAAHLSRLRGRRRRGRGVRPAVAPRPRRAQHDLPRVLRRAAGGDLCAAPPRGRRHAAWSPHLANANTRAVARETWKREPQRERRATQGAHLVALEPRCRSATAAARRAGASRDEHRVAQRLCPTRQGRPARRLRPARDAEQS
jgi:hypothetical protein